MRIRSMIIILLQVLGLSACSHFGSYQLSPDRMSYNKALNYSDNQQLLLNMVRLRYTDTPYFLGVSNVVSQFSLTRSLDLSFANGTSPGVMFTGDGNTSISEMPTITYTPLQGQEYITRLLTPIDLSVVYLLQRSGWRIDQLMRMLVVSMGPLQNARLASRAVSSTIPVFKKFQDLCLALRALENQNNLRVTPELIENKFSLKISILEYNDLTPQQRLFFAKLGLSRQNPSFWIMTWPSNQPRMFRIEIRTVMSLLNFLSKSVDLPPMDIKKHHVKETYEINGQRFDWRLVTRGIMRIHTSKFYPKENYLAVQYRNHWFYVADTDFVSKETFHIVSIILGIYQGEIKSFLPIFTVS